MKGDTSTVLPKVAPSTKNNDLWITSVAMISCLLAGRLRKRTSGRVCRPEKRKVPMRSWWKDVLKLISINWIKDFRSRRRDKRGLGIKCREQNRDKMRCWDNHSLVKWEPNCLGDKEEISLLKGKRCYLNPLIFLKLLSRNYEKTNSSTVLKILVKSEIIYPLQEKYW
jgi:hypothetical protein